MKEEGASKERREEQNNKRGIKDEENKRGGSFDVIKNRRVGKLGIEALKLDAYSLLVFLL